MSDERGFSIAELLVAAAIAVVTGWTMLRVVGTVVTGANDLTARTAASGAVDRLSDRLESDAATAWAVFVPAADVLGNANADGHELDVATQDGAAHRWFWAYRWDATAQTVTCYAYVPGSGSPVPGVRFDGIARFRALARPVDDLARSDSGVYDPLLAGTGAKAVDVDLGWGGQVKGGNGIVSVRIGGAGIDRDLTLVTAAAPTHFTVIVEYTPAPAATP